MCEGAARLVALVSAGLVPSHADAEIILSFPGLGTQLGARVLAGIGDDRKRFADARGGKAYIGTSPIHQGFREEVQHHPQVGQERPYQPRYELSRAAAVKADSYRRAAL